MTSDEDQARLIAERIARRVSGGVSASGSFRKQNGSDIGAELSAIHSSLDNLKQKLSQLESRLSQDNSESTRQPDVIESQGGMNWATSGSPRTGMNPTQFAGTYAPSHPSQERFGVEEATVSELVDFFEGEKKCELEPGGKPCDHCAMCSSRGF